MRLSSRDDASDSSMGVAALRAHGLLKVSGCGGSARIPSPHSDEWHVGDSQRGADTRVKLPDGVLVAAESSSSEPTQPSGYRTSKTVPKGGTGKACGVRFAQ
jgi:hypothetical protein